MFHWDEWAELKSFPITLTALLRLREIWWKFYDVAKSTETLLKIRQKLQSVSNIVSHSKKGWRAGEAKNCARSNRSQQGQISCGFSLATKCHFFWALFCLEWAWILSFCFPLGRHRKKLQRVVFQFSFSLFLNVCLTMKNYFPLDPFLRSSVCSIESLMCQNSGDEKSSLLVQLYQSQS